MGFMVYRQVVGNYRQNFDISGSICSLDLTCGTGTIFQVDIDRFNHTTLLDRQILSTLPSPVWDT